MITTQVSERGCLDMASDDQDRISSGQYIKNDDRCQADARGQPHRVNSQETALSGGQSAKQRSPQTLPSLKVFVPQTAYDLAMLCPRGTLTRVTGNLQEERDGRRPAMTLEPLTGAHPQPTQPQRAGDYKPPGGILCTSALCQRRTTKLTAASGMAHASCCFLYFRKVFRR